MWHWLQIMFDKYKNRNLVCNKWQALLRDKITLEGYPITEEISKATLKLFVDLLSDSMMLYTYNNYMSNKTLRLLALAKRLLADKKSFDAVKCIDYLVAGHSILKYKVDRVLRERIIAHFWRIIAFYQQGILSGKQVSSVVSLLSSKENL